MYAYVFEVVYSVQVSVTSSRFGKGTNWGRTDARAAQTQTQHMFRVTCCLLSSIGRCSTSNWHKRQLLHRLGNWYALTALTEQGHKIIDKLLHSFERYSQCQFIVYSVVGFFTLH